VTLFWIVAAVLAVIAPLFVAFPLLSAGRAGSGPGASNAEMNLSVYRDQLAELDAERRSGRLAGNKYEQARGELESRMLEEVPDAAAPAAAPVQRSQGWTAFAASVAVPLLAVSVYLLIGNPGALQAQTAKGPHGLGQQQMDAMIARLAERLQKNPQDPKGWAMLARAQTVLGRFSEASAAYARSVEIFPDDAQLLADYADALAMAQGGRLPGAPEKLIERALRVDPDNAKALALAGTLAFNNSDFARAVQHWERLRGLMPPDSEFAKSIRANIAEAKTRLQASAAAQPPPQASARR
jgi:cytochrome c-type biogenesis protein CcmH